MKKIWLSPPHMGGEELHYIREAFDQNWIAPLGPNVNGFEEDLENHLGNHVHVAALSSGTAALHLALILLDIGPGDEVLCQSMTFSASANPIVYQGATPVFIDSERETWNLSPELLERAIRDRLEKGTRPKAIIAVHLYGMPYQVEAIHDIAVRYEIPVIEDAAEALGSTYKNQECGSLGELAILSFNGNKIITTSGGGALVTHVQSIKEKAVFYATQSRDPAPHYQHSDIGYNYRMSNVLAGIGRGQMQVLEDRVNARRHNYEQYRTLLQENKHIEFVAEPADTRSNRWLTTLLTDSYDTREAIRHSLENHHIESRPLWKPLHLQPIFEKYPRYLNGVSEDLFERGLCLPSGSALTQEERERVAEMVLRDQGPGKRD